jgi:hypothetical protein
MRAGAGAGLGLALSVLAAACSRSNDRPAQLDAGAPTRPPIAAREEPPATPSRETRSDQVERAVPESDAPLERALEEAPIVALAPAREALRFGTFDATLDAPDGPLRAELRVALVDAPRAHRRALAFHRLARALDAPVVLARAERHVSVGALAEELRASPDLVTLLGARAAMVNDGTVSALVSVLPPEGARVLGMGDAVLGHLAVAARAPAPVPDEDARLVASYVWMRVLDYLAGNLLRRGAVLDDRAHALRLVDDDDAFPAHLDADGQEHLLAELRQLRRFPRSLRSALAGLDKARARTLFASGDFDDWLLVPRTLVELDERRVALVTLLDARSVERGEAEVLSLP